MTRTENLDADGERSLIVGLGLGKISREIKQLARVIERQGRLGMFVTEQFQLNGQSLLHERLGLAILFQFAVERSQLVEVAHRIAMRVPLDLSPDGQCPLGGGEGLAKVAQIAQAAAFPILLVGQFQLGAIRWRQPLAEIDVALSQPRVGDAPVPLAVSRGKQLQQVVLSSAG